MLMAIIYTMAVAGVVLTVVGIAKHVYETNRDKSLRKVLR